MILYLACSYLIATAEMACSPPMPLSEALGIAAALNDEYPYVGRTTPVAIYAADDPPQKP